MYRDDFDAVHAREGEQEQLMAALVRGERLRLARALALATMGLAAVFAFLWFATHPDPEPPPGPPVVFKRPRLDPEAAAERRDCVAKAIEGYRRASLNGTKAEGAIAPDHGYALQSCAWKFPDRNDPDEGVSLTYGLPR